MGKVPRTLKQEDTLRLIRKDGTEVKPGDTLIDFRGDKHEFVAVTRGGSRIYTQHHDRGLKQEFFPSVFPGHEIVE